MSIEHKQTAVTTLHCDMEPCLAKLVWPTYLAKTHAERMAREQHGWRKDKLGRNVCPRHPKLKGAKT